MLGQRVEYYFTLSKCVSPSETREAIFESLKYVPEVKIENQLHDKNDPIKITLSVTSINGKLEQEIEDTICGNPISGVRCVKQGGEGDITMYDKRIF
jgi:hypothetical protein